MSMPAPFGDPVKMTAPTPCQPQHLRQLINVSGTMTRLGSSIALPEVIEATAAILPRFVDMDQLQRQASAAIAQACGAQAGFVTASCSAAITLAVAAAITGPDLALIERLPDTRGLKQQVLIQAGHLVNYGAPLAQAIALAGASVVPVGQATSALAYQLAGAINEHTACAVYVVSHHTVQSGLIGLADFIACCHARGVPVIVDAASEYDLHTFLAQGADLALYSAHKFLGGPTAGIVAGKQQLVRAAYLQNRGIGRGMKVGKEGVAGTIAALQAWQQRDHAGIRRREAGILALWQATLAGRAGIACEIEADPTGNPLSRLRVTVDAELAQISAWDLADALADGEIAVMVRDHELEQGLFQLDPCNLHPGEEHIVAQRLRDELDRAAGAARPVTPLAQRRQRQIDALLRWPD
jgi:D-glucosaminate-6-phosphate ammonia-lyase